MLERKHMLRETLWRQAPKGHTWVMAVYDCLLLRGSGDTEETLLTSLRAEITKAEQEGWQLRNLEGAGVPKPNKFKLVSS